jgi:methyl-accepting chemotaxis protein
MRTLELQIANFARLIKAKTDTPFNVTDASIAANDLLSGRVAMRLESGPLADLSRRMSEMEKVLAETWKRSVNQYKVDQEIVVTTLKIQQDEMRRGCSEMALMKEEIDRSLFEQREALTSILKSMEVMVERLERIVDRSSVSDISRL